MSFNVFFPYTEPQYICSGLLMFVAAEVLEGKILLPILSFMAIMIIVVLLRRTRGGGGVLLPWYIEDKISLYGYEKIRSNAC